MKKIDNLQKNIDDLKKAAPTTKPSKNLSPIVDVGAELVAGVLVGVVIGLIFDNLFASKPLFLIICIILSIVAAFRSIWKKYINKS